MAYTDAKDNIYPRKDRNEYKIDGTVAAIMALGRAMSTDRVEEDGITQGFIDPWSIL